VTLNDPAYVREQYAVEDGLAARRSIYARTTGPHPDDVALAAIAEARPRSLLEVGCGQGQLARRIADELGAEVVAVDQSARMVELARGLGIDARVADAHALPFDDGAFDCALAHFVLFHLSELDRGLAELSRVLRPGGRLVASTNARDHLREVWELVGAREAREGREVVFSAENGAEVLRGHFARVDVRDAGGTVEIPGHDGLLRYLGSTSEWRHLVDRVPADVADPFPARRSTVVFVAETGA
jgi:SAM-dependent methyltransferase